MAAHNWELVRDFNLAQWRGDAAECERIDALIRDSQQECAEHVPNPERPERCYKCGYCLRPAVRKCESTNAAIRKTG